MKRLRKWSFISSMVLLLLLVFPGTVYAQGPDNDGKVVFGGNYVLTSGNSLGGDLVVLGGTARLEDNTVVEGSVVVAGGSITVQGEIEGDIVAMGGTVSLEDTAIVHGSINSLGASIKRSDKAVVEGGLHIQTPGELELDIPNLPDMPSIPTLPQRVAPLLNSGLNFISDILWIFLQSLALAALAVVLALFLATPINRSGQTLVRQPIASGGLGLLTLIIAPGLVIVLAITIILLPVSILAVFVLALAIVFGWIVVGKEIGERMANALKVEWSVAVAAGVGTLILSLLGAAIAKIPCVGWFIPSIIAIIGLGAVLLSRFGTHAPESHVPAPAPVMPVAPRAPIAPTTPEAPSAPQPPAIDVEQTEGDVK